LFKFNVPPLCVRVPENVFAPAKVNAPPDNPIEPVNVVFAPTLNVPPDTETAPPSVDPAVKLNVPFETVNPPDVVTAPLNVTVFNPDFTKLNAVGAVSVNVPDTLIAPEAFVPPKVKTTGADVLDTLAFNVIAVAESLVKDWSPTRPIRSPAAPIVKRPAPVF
jgi:hypothetical protein